MIAQEARTEVELVADALARLILAGLLIRPRTAAVTEQACQTVGITVADLNRGFIRQNLGDWTPPGGNRTPPADDPEPAPPPARPRPPIERPGPPCAAQGCNRPTIRRGLHGRFPKFCPEHRAEATAAAKDGRRVPRRAPEGPIRVCIRCQAEKPIDQFLQRTDQPTRRTTCDDCRRRYARERYARVGTVVVAVELLAGDRAVGAPCSCCGSPMRAGEVVAMDGDLRHEACPR